MTVEKVTELAADALGLALVDDQDAHVCAYGPQGQITVSLGRRGTSDHQSFIITITEGR